jgi:hypothetical protein
MGQTFLATPLRATVAAVRDPRAAAVDVRQGKVAFNAGATPRLQAWTTGNASVGRRYATRCPHSSVLAVSSSAGTASALSCLTHTANHVPRVTGT